MKKLLLILLTLGLLACGSKKENKQSETSSKPVISVVNYPLYYFAERIGGEHIELAFPIPEDADPAYWVPNSESLTIFQESDIIFTNGANYAKWLNNVSLPERIIVNTSAPIKEKYIEVQEGASHSHGDGEEHMHTGMAFTTWLDFEIAIVQAESIKSNLEKILPNKKKQIEENFEALKKDLLNLDSKLKALSTSEYIIGSHPVYQYLSEAYQLNIHSVHFEPNEMPSSKQWHELEHLLEDHPSFLMIWENEPTDEIKNELKLRKIRMAVFNPCGNKPKQGDFLSIMNGNVKTLTSIQATDY